MRKLALFLFILVFLAGVPQPKSADAGTKACTQSMVDVNICRDSANHLLFFDAPPAFWLSMADGICATQGYQEEIDGSPNPQSCKQFAQEHIMSVFLSWELDTRAKSAGEAASDAVRAEPEADVGDGS